MLTGADAVVRGLEAAGVKVAFGLPGVHNLSLWRALEESPIRLVGVRHEQTAAYAADGYARAGGGLGVAVVTTGPGAANTLGAVGEAFASRSPLLVIATDIPTSLRRPGIWRGSLHETTDQAGMFRPVVKAALRAPKGTDLERAVAEAVAAARTPPARPAYLEIPTDVLQAEARESTTEAPSAEPAPLPHDPFVRAGELMARSRSPLVWAGGGAVVAGAGEAVGELAKRLVAPVLTTYSSRGLLPADHPCDVGVSAHFREAGKLWDEADLVIAIGSDLDGMMTQNWEQPQPPHLVAVNVDAEDASKNYLPDLVLETDAARGTAALVHHVEQRGGLDALASRLERLRSEVRAELEQTDPAALGFLDVFDRALPPETVVVCDMCIPGYWLGALRRPAAPRRLLYPLGWGTLGCAFPQALGAALAVDAPVVSVSGDGGFLYACGELAAAAQEGIPVTAVVIDDGGYGMLRFDQELHGDPQLGVNLTTPDFEALAHSFGVRAEAVDGLGEAFEAKLQHHATLREPTLLVAKAALGPPPNVSPRWYRRQG
jgi:acetolactate synthase-1/2/3 large subunit